MSNIEAMVEPSEDGHGFGALVKRDGKTIYSSATKHGKAGVFEEERVAQEHAEAWAECERQLPEEAEKLKNERSLRCPGETLVLKAQAREALDRAKDLKAAAKRCDDDAAACEQRVEALAEHAVRPRLRIHWDRQSPTSVKLQVEESAWDEPFKPAEVDGRQMSLPGTNWQVTAMDGDVARAIGYGRVEVSVENGELTITLGAGEHQLVGKLAGELRQAESREPAPPKRASPFEPKTGKLKDKALRERLPHIGRAETLLGLYKLELARKPKPRQRVLQMISTLAADHDEPRLIDDIVSLDDGRTSTALVPDLAAAAIVTLAADEGDVAVLEQLVPECGDSAVLSDLLDDEHSRGGRDEVTTVIRQRMAELAPVVEGDESEDEDDQLELDDYGYGNDGRPQYDA